MGSLCEVLFMGIQTLVQQGTVTNCSLVLRDENTKETRNEESQQSSTLIKRDIQGWPWLSWSVFTILEYLVSWIQDMWSRISRRQLA